MAQGDRDETSAVQKLADWALSIPSEDIPQAAFAQGKLLVLDTLGCGFAALEEEASRAIIETIEFAGGAPQCSVIGRTHKTSFANAVLANGALVRVLDLNDYVIEADGNIGGHPSDNIPVTLAAGELYGCSGRDILAAIVLGYEVYGHFRTLMDRRSAWDGVTVSGLVAPIIAGRLMGLDLAQLANAVALSVARAATSATVRAGDISAAKSLANALVAQNGVQAALLAKSGLTGPVAIFEHPRGMSAVFPKLGSAGRAVPHDAASYIMKAHVKAYPCVVTAQAAIAAGIEIHRLVGGEVDRLRRIRVAMADYPTVRRHQQDPGRADPLSREAADHSLGFLVAVTLLDGAFGPAQFEHERWRDQKVRDVMGRLQFVTDPDLSRRAPLSYPCVIEAEAQDGGTHRVQVLFPPGFSQGGVETETVLRKFRAVTAGRLKPDACERMIEAVLQMDQSDARIELSGR